MNDLSSQNFALVIPARYESSRFPGKPLISILGKTMIQRVWERCCLAVGNEKVYVATDDDRIEEAVGNFGGRTLRTSSNCLTGTDRLAEANKTLECDFLVNVQGDEPIVEPENILSVAKHFISTGNITNAFCEITSETEFHSLTVPKVVMSPSGRLMYMSRSNIPLTKSGTFVKAYKQVCIYAFSKSHLEFFASHTQKSPMESIEDIEILRFLEADIQVDMVQVPAGSLSVDVPEDVEAIEEFLKNTRK